MTERALQQMIKCTGKDGKEKIWQVHIDRQAKVGWLLREFARS
jgi:hypothetical protein